VLGGLFSLTLRHATFPFPHSKFAKRFWTSLQKLSASQHFSQSAISFC
jgi:hypothetical protein